MYEKKTSFINVMNVDENNFTNQKYILCHDLAIFDKYTVNLCIHADLIRFVSIIIIYDEKKNRVDMHVRLGLFCVKSF